MNTVKAILLGSNPKTTIIGYLLAILTAVKPVLENTSASTADVWATVFTALITALFGRMAADAKKPE